MAGSLYGRFSFDPEERKKVWPTVDVDRCGGGKREIVFHHYSQIHPLLMQLRRYFLGSVYDGCVGYAVQFHP